MKELDVDENEITPTPKRSLWTQLKEIRPFFKIVLLVGFLVLFFGTGFLAGTLYWEQNKLKEESKGRIIGVNNHEEDYGGDEPNLSDEPIRSPFNGVILTEEEYENNIEHIPHVVLISNNKSARDEQYGLTFADVVYEAQTEGGITRFMALFWNKQSGYIMKPVRSVRKYFFDWAIEYGNIPVSFSGFPVTNNYDTNAWGFYKEKGIRVTYWDWPFDWDAACLVDHPSMHCKSTSPEVLYGVFKEHEWTYESWTGFEKQDEWKFSEDLATLDEYEDVIEFTYDFGWASDWSSRWVYNDIDKVFHKYEPDDLHVDMNNKNVISASTIIIQKVERRYTGDDAGRVTYKTVSSGDAFILRDGKKIDATWEKTCYECRTFFYSKQVSEGTKQQVELKPGLIWIAAVPTDKEVNWTYASQEE